MDVDFTNSLPEAQVDLMTMMFEMENLADFSKPPPQPSAEFPSGPPPAFYNAPNNNTPPSSLLVGVPSSMAFSDPTMITSNTLAAGTSSELPLGGSSQSSKWASVEAMREMIFLFMISLVNGTTWVLECWTDNSLRGKEI